MKCPKCKSDNIKKLSAILDQDTTTLNLGTNLAGVIGSIGGGGNKVGVGLGKAGTSGQVKSKLVKKIEKQIPKRPSMALSIILGFIIVISGGDYLFYDSGGDLWVYLIMIILFIWSVKNYKKKSKLYSSQMKYFRKKWYCFKCGATLIV